MDRTIRACRLCRDRPAGRPIEPEPRPILVLSASARICIAGQAPGNRAYQSGIPFSDPSGERLRDWMGIGPETFYDASRIAIVPMGFCFPGLDAHGGDCPPRRECAPTWHGAVFEAMPQLELLLLVGGHAQRWHGRRRDVATLTGGVEGAVQAWREVVQQPGRPTLMPLPHPSGRNNAWLRRNPWFTRDLLPDLRRRVAELL